MEELQLLSRQKPGEVIIDNFQELREELSGVLNRYEHLVYTDGMLADLYAKRWQEIKGWDNVKLEYLSEWFGIQQKNAHRAWCDAEANAELYEKLKELR